MNETDKRATRAGPAPELARLAPEGYRRGDGHLPGHSLNDLSSSYIHARTKLAFAEPTPARRSSAKALPSAGEALPSPAPISPRRIANRARGQYRLAVKPQAKAVDHWRKEFAVATTGVSPRGRFRLDAADEGIDGIDPRDPNYFHAGVTANSHLIVICLDGVPQATAIKARLSSNPQCADGWIERMALKYSEKEKPRIERLHGVITFRREI